jgi:hypothetical protein
MRIQWHFSQRHVINNGHCAISSSACWILHNRFSIRSSIIFHDNTKKMVADSIQHTRRFHTIRHCMTSTLFFDQSRPFLFPVPAIRRHYRTNSYDNKNKPKNENRNYEKTSAKLDTSVPITTIQQAQSTMQHLLDRLDEMAISPPNVTMMRDGIIHDFSYEEYRLFNTTIEQTEAMFDVICQRSIKIGRMYLVQLQLLLCGWCQYGRCRIIQLSIQDDKTPISNVSEMPTSLEYLDEGMEFGCSE